ncbi:resuscitation-promoting factor [uncultured Aeromicrobium sp.]|uniref:resuscitation-promoting factor n=1 Tax=uncultured Aeromicrobium sp. TaxID=337820 RepID=UPI0025DB03E0|nr:resuscitation-promoting factor [uncultured Aeromicrobium sp.]
MQLSLPEFRPKNVLKLVAAVAAVVTATAGLVAAAGFDQKVTLDVDGEITTTRTSAETVDEFLTSQGIEPRPEDKVSHDLDDPLPDETISVRYAKPVTVVVDGETTDELTYATSVEELLDDLDVEPAEGAYLSAKLDDKINRFGDEIVVSSPKTLTVTADGRDQQIETNKPTVSEVLDEAGVTVDEDDEVEPGLETYLAKDTSALRVVRIEKVTRTETVPVDFEVQVQEDASLPRGERQVVNEGQPGEVAEEVLLVLADGQVRERTVVSRSTVREPVAQVEKRGTKQPATAPAVADGSVWDRLAQCESGGNWAANTGNGYYGGVQFSAQTWRSVGGSGLPHQHSREEQIHRASILQQRAGWGQWPSCSAKLGLR